MFFYCELINKGISVLADDEAHHLRNVLHLRKGERIRLFDGNGKSAAGSILKISKDFVEIAVEEITTHRKKESGRVVIAASVAKGERFDWLIGKCTELGVDVIWPVLFERTVKQASAHSVERYRKLAFAAAKQCERVFLPVIKQPTAFPECISQIRKEFENISIFFGSVDQEAASIFEEIAAGKDYAAFVGPEGGLTVKEEEILKNLGATGVRLTKTILRTETAAEAFAAILCSHIDWRV